MKPFFIITLGLMSAVLLTSCSSDRDLPIAEQQKLVVTEKGVNFPDYLKRENGTLFCEYGDPQTPLPKAGTIYSKQKVSVVSSPETLEIINLQYAKDQIHVYTYESVCSEEVPNACNCDFSALDFDASSFEVLDDHHIKDQNQVIIFGMAANEIDAKSFELLKTKDGKKTPYGKDKNNVYHYGEIIKESDYQSFEVLSQSKAKDKNHLYEEGVVLN